MGDLSAADSSNSIQATSMSVQQPQTIWPPPAYNGKVRFDVWEAQLDMFIADMGITEKPKKARALLQHIGSEMLEKIMDWTAPKKPQEMDYDELMQLLRDKFTKKPNLFAMRVKFFNERQQPGQSLEDYFSHLTRLFGQCKLDEMKADDYAVLAALKGLADDDTRQYLMTSSTKIENMAKVQELATNFEQGKAAAKEIKGYGGKASNEPYSIDLVSKAARCDYCGDVHQRGKENCPAKDKRCKNCGKQDHFARVCKSEAIKKQNLVKDYCESMNGIYGVLTVSSGHEDSIPPYKVAAKLNGITVNLQHDTGSGVSVISKKIWKLIGKPRIYASSVKLRSYNQMIPVLGQSIVTVQIGKQIKQQWVIVVQHGVSLIGRNWIQAFNVQLQRHCNEADDRKQDDTTCYKQHTVSVNFPKDSHGEAKARGKSTYRQDKVTVAEHVHDPMQGKEKVVTGKDSKRAMVGFSAVKSHSKISGDTVLKGIKSQQEMQRKISTDKDWAKSFQQANRGFKDRKDRTCKYQKQNTRDTVATTDHEKATTKKAIFQIYHRESKAITGSNVANQHDRRTKIYKNTSYKSGGADGNIFDFY